MDHPETADAFHARVAAAADDQGRLPVAIELMSRRGDGPGWES